MKSLIYSASLFFLLYTSSAYAAASIDNWREYVYLIELAVIGLVALALIVLTLTISAQKKRSSRLFIDFREEVKQEKAIIHATMDEMKDKEKQITYMAHMLQKHLRESVEDSQLKKKSQDALLSDFSELGTNLMELPALEIDPAYQDATGLPSIEQQSDSSSPDVSFIDEAFDSLTDDDVDPRKVSADGSVKTEHLGAHGYMETIKVHQESAWKKSADMSKTFVGLLNKIIEQTDTSLNTTKQHRDHLKESVAILQADIERAESDNDSRSDGLINTMIDLEGRIRLLHDYENNLRSVYSNTLEQLSGYDAPEFIQEADEVSPVKAAS